MKLWKINDDPTCRMASCIDASGSRGVIAFSTYMICKTRITIGTTKSKRPTQTSHARLIAPPLRQGRCFHPCGIFPLRCIQIAASVGTGDPEKIPDIVAVRASCTLQIDLRLLNIWGRVLDRRSSGCKPGKGGSQGWQLAPNYVNGLQTSPGAAEKFMGTQGLRVMELPFPWMYGVEFRPVFAL